MKIKERIKESEFEKDIREGLMAGNKRLSSKYFYDEKGDVLFQQIMHLPEYYLTRSEFEIFLNHSKDIVHVLGLENAEIEIIELGAGDGTKTLLFLKELVEKNVKVKYRPVDISRNVLTILKKKINTHLPKVQIESVTNTYQGALELLSNAKSDTKRLIFFLGSNLGNLTMEEGKNFINGIANSLRKGDAFLIGLDKKKDPQRIIDAYSDSAGVTKEFNLNLLDRINRELGANFDRSQYKHIATYDPITGTTKSFLISQKDQEVYLPWAQKSIFIKAFEAINTEISQKYDGKMVEELFKNTGMELAAFFEDEEELFRDYLFIK